MGGHILLADDVMSYRVLIRARLFVAHYNVVMADSVEDVHPLAVSETPDLAIIGVGQNSSKSLDLIRTMKSDPLTSDVTILVVCDNQANKTRVQALKAGADDVLSRSASEAFLLASLRNLMRRRNEDAELNLREDTRVALGFSEAAAGFGTVKPPPTGTIALVTGNPKDSVSWKRRLETKLRDRIETLTPRELPDLDDGSLRPDLYVIEANLRHPSHGFALITDLRSRSISKDAGIVAIFDPTEEEAATHALDLGANAVLDTTASDDELIERIRCQLRRKAQQDRVRREIKDGLLMAITDPLTGLKNRRYAISSLKQIAENSNTNGKPFAVMMLDLDRFKRVNDTYGHPAGDAVLKAAAERIESGLRSDDIIARLGGEEFIVIMPETTPKDAQVAGERLRLMIEDIPFKLPDNDDALHLTVSIGIAVGNLGTPASLLIEEADRALYAAKEEGRNLVNMSSPAA